MATGAHGAFVFRYSPELRKREMKLLERLDFSAALHGNAIPSFQAQASLAMTESVAWQLWGTIIDTRSNRFLSSAPPSTPENRGVSCFQESLLLVLV